MKAIINQEAVTSQSLGTKFVGSEIDVVPVEEFHNKGFIDADGNLTFFAVDLGFAYQWNAGTGFDAVDETVNTEQVAGTDATEGANANA